MRRTPFVPSLTDWLAQFLHESFGCPLVYHCTQCTSPAGGIKHGMGKSLIFHGRDLTFLIVNG